MCVCVRRYVCVYYVYTYVGGLNVYVGMYVCADTHTHTVYT